MYDELLKFAVQLAKAAGGIQLAYFRGDRLSIETKSNVYDVVTRADRESEELIAGMIAERYPDHAILGEEGGCFRVCFQSRYDIDPVQRMQLVEMDCMVMHVKYCFHNVAHHLRIGRNGDVQRLFHRTHGAERMNGSTHTANTSHKYPGIAGIAVAYNIFYSAYHCTGTVCLFYFAAFDGCFYP